MTPIRKLTLRFILIWITLTLTLDYSIHRGGLSERPVVIILVWTLLISVTVLMVADWFAYRLIRNQESQTELGEILKRQYYSLSLRHFAMIVFHFILAYWATTGMWPMPVNYRISAYVAAVMGGVVASWYAGRFVRWLRDNRGML